MVKLNSATILVESDAQSLTAAAVAKMVLGALGSLTARAAAWLLAASLFILSTTLIADADPHGKRPQGVNLDPLFQLRTQHGSAFTREALKGRPAAVFFGYTHCPDVCPTTLLEMTQHLEALGPDGDRLRVVFVTVDPERDNPSHLKEFVGSFDRRIVALTGSTLEIASAAHGFGATFERVERKDGSYTMDHTTKVYLLDRYGLVASHIETGQATADQRKALKRLLAQ